MDVSSDRGRDKYLITKRSATWIAHKRWVSWIALFSQVIAVEPPIEEGFRCEGCPGIVFGAPVIDFLADFGDERRQQLFISGCTQGLVGREPALLWEKRGVG